jgi:hypothetical protein
MSLVDLHNELAATLVRLEAARKGAQDVEDVDRRAQQWTEKLGGLERARQRASWLNVDLSEVPPYPERFAYAQELAREAAGRLEQRRDIEGLTEHDLWVRLLETVEKATSLAYEQTKNVWRLCAEGFDELTPPSQLRATASPVPQNDVLLAQYEEHYRTASRLAALEAPRSAGDREILADAVTTCKGLIAQLKFDAPKDVEEFFRAVNAGGASLALVTPTVLAWLAESGLLERYVVRGRER